MKDLKPIGVKAPLALLPRNALCAIAGVIEHGARKYSPWNWMDNSQPQARIEELHNALLRHVYSSSDPSQPDIDEESGIHHLAHAGACIMILLYKLGIDYVPSNFVKEQREIVDTPHMGRCEVLRGETMLRMDGHVEVDVELPEGPSVLTVAGPDGRVRTFREVVE